MTRRPRPLRVPAVALLAASLLAAAAAAPAREPATAAQEPAPAAQETAAAGEAWELETPAPVHGALLERLEGTERIACAECHAEVVAEWSQTLHALAWVDELFHRDLETIRKPEGCHGCHAPEPLIAAGVPRKPEVRADDVELGVDCATCHLGPDGETIHGPWGLAHDAHPSVRDPLFADPSNNELCVACHATFVGPVVGLAKDFEASEAAARGLRCVDCHMAPVERVLTSVVDAEGEPAVRVGRSHLLQTPRDPAFLRRAFEVTARTTAEGVVVRLANRASHRVPGLQGRRLTFRFEVVDAAGERLAGTRVELDHRAGLKVDAHREVTLQARGAAVRVTGRHVDPRLEEPVDFLDLELPLDG